MQRRAHTHSRRELEMSDESEYSNMTPELCFWLYHFERARGEKGRCRGTSLISPNPCPFFYSLFLPLTVCCFPFLILPVSAFHLFFVSFCPFSSSSSLPSSIHSSFFLFLFMCPLPHPPSLISFPVSVIPLSFLLQHSLPLAYQG